MLVAQSLMVGAGGSEERGLVRVSLAIPDVPDVEVRVEDLNGRPGHPPPNATQFYGTSRAKKSPLFRPSQ
jgi:hypothetical protein